MEYTALKRHFTSKSYDYFKYNGKVRTNFDAFCKRNDIYYFSKISNELEPKDVLLANIFHNPAIWIKDIVDSKEVYLAWKKRVDALTYTFTSDLSRLKDQFSDNFRVEDKHSYPFLIDLYNQKLVTPETATILIHLSNTSSYWKESVADTIVFPDILFKLERYHGFLQYDKKKFTKILKEHFFQT